MVCGGRAAGYLARLPLTPPRSTPCLTWPAASGVGAAASTPLAKAGAAAKARIAAASSAVMVRVDWVLAMVGSFRRALGGTALTLGRRRGRRMTGSAPADRTFVLRSSRGGSRDPPGGLAAVRDGAAPGAAATPRGRACGAYVVDPAVARLSARLSARPS